jgi:ketosteroid isomerase-like protein
MPGESTTPDLAKVVTGLFEAADRGDWDAVIGPYAPDCTWESDDGIMDNAGPRDVRGFWEEFFGMFEDYTIRAETVVDLGNGVVYSVYQLEGRPLGSGAVLTERAALIYTWADGMIARVLARRDIDEGRATAERLAEDSN